VLADVLCFSHLRWNFVFQRPQHLLSRCARDHRVFFVEEPVFDAAHRAPAIAVTSTDCGVHVVVPLLPEEARENAPRHLRRLLDGMMAEHRVRPQVLWYYTPMAMQFSDHINAPVVVYDCMDELSGFAGAPPGLLDAERALLARADLVFTGGRSLYEAKKHRHRNIHPFPSSVDVQHFGRARRLTTAEPDDQAEIPHPRIGFFGVLDERFDSELIREAAQLRPDWHFALVGPTVKIDPASLPHASNIHYLGQKGYADLPSYLAGWDVAMLPFARNEATRFISPTKTPEYLAGGKPVVSTSITDVVHPYGDLGLARIADTPEAFVAAVSACLAEDQADRLRRADRLLRTMSWDTTWAAMAEHIRALGRKEPHACSITSSSEPVSLEQSWQSVSPPLQAKRS
jgi:glycosyltransferase involved in cell wall biosynthesis